VRALTGNSTRSRGRSDVLRSPENTAQVNKAFSRDFKRRDYPIIGILGLCWALFQLSVAGFFILDSTRVRAIHLAFALAMAFLAIPISKRRTRPIRFLHNHDHIPLLDVLLAVLGSLSALYITLAWTQISTRAGNPTTTDLVIGAMLVILLLEGGRRAIGPALSIIAVLFTIYAFTGPYLPDILAFKGVSPTKYLNQVSLSTEGIYGIPLGVSASIVYLFVLLGALLDRAGAGRFFIQLALSLLGRYKGGPAKTAVVASAFTGLVSGSSVANIVTTGTFTIPLMKKVGYPAKKAAATEVAASTDGQLMPPIMGAAAFIIAEYVNVPYLDVVKAAAIPAFVSYCALFYITHLEASKLGLGGLSREETPRFFATLKTGFHYLIPIGVLIFELVVLRHTAELAAYRAICVLVPLVLIQEIRRATKNDLGVLKGIENAVRMIAGGCIRGSRNMAPVALATAAAGIIVGVVNMGIGGMITHIVEQVARGNILLLLVITAVASLMLGMGLPTTATYVVMASLTAPIIVQVGGAFGFVVPLMAAHLFCFYFGILADDTPPVGLASYTAAAIAGSDPIPTGIQGFAYDLRTAVIPFMFVFNPDLILHNIHSWGLALLIFGMAVLGAFAFTSVIQGWLITVNRWYEALLLLPASLILFHPGSLCTFIGVGMDMKYYVYPLGVAIVGAVYGLQKIRIRGTP